MNPIQTLSSSLLAILALISGQAVISALLVLVVMGLIFWLLYWLLHKINPPEPFLKIGDAILAIAAVVLLINLLLSLIGKQFITWP